MSQKRTSSVDPPAPPPAKRKADEQGGISAIAEGGDGTEYSLGVFQEDQTVVDLKNKIAEQAGFAVAGIVLHLKSDLREDSHDLALKDHERVSEIRKHLAPTTKRLELSVMKFDAGIEDLEEACAVESDDNGRKLTLSLKDEDEGTADEKIYNNIFHTLIRTLPNLDVKQLNIGPLIEAASECFEVFDEDGCLKDLSNALRDLPSAHPLQQFRGVADASIWDNEDAPHLDSHFKASLQYRSMKKCRSLSFDKLLTDPGDRSSGGVPGNGGQYDVMTEVFREVTARLPGSLQLRELSLRAPMLELQCPLNDSWDGDPISLCAYGAVHLREWGTSRHLDCAAFEALADAVEGLPIEHELETIALRFAVGFVCVMRVCLCLCLSVCLSVCVCVSVCRCVCVSVCRCLYECLCMCACVFTPS
jgi:hypothetical protein